MTESAIQIGSKPPCTREDALAVLKTLRAGHVAYFAGGCVRDELLKLSPKDYDVATDAPPARVRKLFPNTQAVGAAFGVILVRQGKSMVEVATFRTDGTYVDGRRPTEVQFTTAEEDAKRRDFTINGLFLDPIENRVIDHVGGQTDLQNKTLRAIGDANHRFDEDHLRLLRAVRFAARFDLRIEPTTAQSIKRHAEQLKRISPERIAEELRLMLMPATRIRAYELLREFGLFEIILRFVADTTQPIGLFVKLVEPTISFGCALAALILDAHAGTISTPTEARKAAAAMRQALKISNDESDELEGSLMFGHLVAESQPAVAQMKRFLAHAASNGARSLMAALARVGVLTDLIQRRLDELHTLAKTDFAPPPLITGDDLTAAGLKPGKLFKRVLDLVYDAQLESRVASKQEAMEMAMEIAKSG